MCFELDSLPPIPQISGGAPVRSEDVVLEAADGTRLAAFGAQPDDGARVGIVVLPDVRGLYRFYEELALRFAERGYAAVAFDYFGRTAGVAKRDDEFPYMEHVAQTTPEGIQQDVRAAVEHLRSPAGGVRPSSRRSTGIPISPRAWRRRSKRTRSRARSRAGTQRPRRPTRIPSSTGPRAPTIRC